MKNSILIIKDEVAFLLKEFTKLIKLYSKRVDDYLKNDYYFYDFQDFEESFMIIVYLMS